MVKLACLFPMSLREILTQREPEIMDRNNIEALWNVFMVLDHPTERGCLGSIARERFVLF